MSTYIRCIVIFLIQAVASVILSLEICDCFQTTTIARSMNCVGNEKNDVHAHSLLSPTPSPMMTAPRIQTHVYSSLSSYFNSMDRFEDDRDDDNDDDTTPSPEYTITVYYEDRSCDIQARSDETILTALERNQMSLERLGLPNSMIPSDCRRGNCLTCTGTHASVSSRLASGTAVVCDGDGLSPHMSRTIQEKGYILTCSTRVVGEGLQLNLGENLNVWKDIYQDRLEEEPTQSAKWAAMARSKRRSDERNQDRWEKHMEKLILEEFDSEGNDDNESL